MLNRIVTSLTYVAIYVIACAFSDRSLTVLISLPILIGINYVVNYNSGLLDGVYAVAENKKSLKKLIDHLDKITTS